MDGGPFTNQQVPQVLLCVCSLCGVHRVVCSSCVVFIVCCVHRVLCSSCVVYLRSCDITWPTLCHGSQVFYLAVQGRHCPTVQVHLTFPPSPPPLLLGQAIHWDDWKKGTGWRWERSGPYRYIYEGMTNKSDFAPYNILVLCQSALQHCLKVSTPCC